MFLNFEIKPLQNRPFVRPPTTRLSVFTKRFFSRCLFRFAIKFKYNHSIFLFQFSFRTHPLSSKLIMMSVASVRFGQLDETC